MRLAFAFVALMLALAAPARAQQTITGAGSSFAAPLYGKWAEAAAAATGITLNYQGIGSGAGINQIERRTVDFGASDAPLASDWLRRHRLLQFPAAIGAVAIIANLPGGEAGRLRLTGPLLADIYLGRITRWNDPRIAAINPGLALPSYAIAPVYRADGSGTTYVFTTYLASQSATWRTRVGVAKSVGWVYGNGARGNDGMAATVGQVRGAIGYVEAAYASEGRLATVWLRNRSGAFVQPTPAAAAAAARHADWLAAPAFAVDLCDRPGAATWPIVAATFVLVPTDRADARRRRAVLTFFDWGFRHGDAIARALHYVPLPERVEHEVRAAWAAAFGAGAPGG